MRYKGASLDPVHPHFVNIYQVLAIKLISSSHFRMFTKWMSVLLGMLAIILPSAVTGMLQGMVKLLLLLIYLTVDAGSSQ